MTSDPANTIAETRPTDDSADLWGWCEDKLQLSHRLQREGRYNQAMQFKEGRRKELRSQGKPKAEANRIAWADNLKQRGEVCGMLGRWAANPELSFTWYDAAVLYQKIRNEYAWIDASRFVPTTFSSVSLKLEISPFVVTVYVS